MKTNSIFPFLCCLLITFFTLQAGNAQSPMTLEECITYGLKNHPDLQEEVINREIASEERKKAFSPFLPDVRATASVDHYWQIPVQAFPAEITGGEPGEFVTIRVGVPWSTTAGVEANLDLIDPAGWKELRITALKLEMSKSQIQSAEALLAKNITQAYYNTALQEKQVAFAWQNLDNYDSLYQVAQVRYEEGLVEQIDVNRVKSTFLAAQDAFQRSQTQHENSLLQLKFWMGMPVRENLQTENLQLSSSFYQPNESFTLQNHPEYDIYQQRRVLATSQMQQSKLNFLPTVSLYASYSRQSFGNSFTLFDSSMDWFGIGLVGGKITLPLFQRTHNFRNVNISRLAVEKAENAFQQFQLDQQTKYLEQENNLAQYIESIRLKEENLQLARENLEIATYKFSQGAYSSIDLKDVQQETLDAQQQYLQAYADYYNTLAELNYLTGKY